MNEIINKLHQFFNRKRVLVLGLGREGLSTLEVLKQIPCEIGIADKKVLDNANLSRYTCHFGDDYLDSMADYDIIMKAPGIPLFDVPQTVKDKITSQTDLFLRFSNVPVIGVTGTKGKSTTSTLISYLLNQCGKKAILAGNIGIPPFDCIKKDIEDAIIVLELSCHQLQYTTSSPNTSVLLNLYPEHLDHYGSYEAYRKAKENIYRYQSKSDTLIYHEHYVSEELLSSPSRKFMISYDKDHGDIRQDETHLFIMDHLIPKSKIRTKLHGQHNLYNIATALACGLLYGCSLEQMLSVLPNFLGLEHRLEWVCNINGADFINDSISTIPSAAIAAVNAFEVVDTIILGGLDRGISYDELVSFLNQENIPNIILLPETGHLLYPKLSENLHRYKVNNMDEAVKKAVEVTKKTCILSPAAASYNTYKNFEERGKHYKSLLKFIQNNMNTQL